MMGQKTFMDIEAIGTPFSGVVRLARGTSLLVGLAAMAAMVMLYAGAAWAASVGEVEPNDSIAGAQNIDASSFDLTANTDIFDSTTVPHATVNGTGNDTRDYYKFAVPAGDPVRVVLDMDHTTPDYVSGDDPQYDSWIELYDSSGGLLDYSDDEDSDPGSTETGDDPWGRDSRIVKTLAPGTYFVGVGNYPELSQNFEPVRAGA